MQWYFQNNFFARKDEMDYHVKRASVGRDDTLLNLLPLNSLATSEYERRHRTAPDIYLCQSFMTVAREFQAIDAPTPYGSRSGRGLANHPLCAKLQYVADDILKEGVRSLLDSPMVQGCHVATP